MKRPFLVLLVVLAAGFGAYAVTRQLNAPAPTTNELAWLTQEFHLSTAQVARIKTLHDDYQPICAAHCAAIFDARNAMAQAQTAEARAAADAEMKRLTAFCQTATHAHLESVAAVMDPAEGQRYLALIEPRLSSHQHAMPFGLR